MKDSKEQVKTFYRNGFKQKLLQESDNEGMVLNCSHIRVHVSDQNSPCIKECCTDGLGFVHICCNMHQ